MAKRKKKQQTFDYLIWLRRCVEVYIGVASLMVDVRTSSGAYIHIKERNIGMKRRNRGIYERND